jgi:hypothetical protein
VLLVGQFNGEGLGSAQDRVRKEKQGVKTQYDTDGIIPRSQFGLAALGYQGFEVGVMCLLKCRHTWG